MSSRFRLGLLIAALLLAALPARAQQLVADLTDHLVAITTGFHGADIRSEEHTSELQSP